MKENKGIGLLNMRTAIVVGVAAIVMVLVAVGVFFLDRPNEVVVSEDLVVYDPNSSSYEILSLDDDSIVVSSMDGLFEGAVLNAGITPVTPSGMLRRLGASEPVDGGFRIQTEQAALTDAIGECDVTFSAVPEGEDGMFVDQDGSKTRFTFVEQAFADESNANIVDKEIGPFLVQAGNTVEGMLRIEGFHVEEMSLVDHASASIELKSLDFSLTDLLGEVDENGKTSSGLKVEDGSIVLGEYSKPIPVQVGPVHLEFDCTIKILYSLEAFCNGVTLDAGASLDRRIGFEYTSKDGTKIINEDNSVAPHFSFGDPEKRVSMGVESTLEAKLDCLLYGLAGPEASVGITGEADGILFALDAGQGGADAIKLPGLDAEFSGRFSAKVFIPISARLLVKADNLLGFINGELINIELFDSGDALTLASCDWRFGTVWETVDVDLGGDYRDLVFYVPDDWNVEQDGRHDPGEWVDYKVTATAPLNSESVELTYAYGNLSQILLSPRFYGTVTLTEIAPADFIPLPQNGVTFDMYDEFVVAKMTFEEASWLGAANESDPVWQGGATGMGITRSYTSEELKQTSRLVLAPKSWMGTRKLTGAPKYLGFPYGGPNSALSDGIESMGDMMLSGDPSPDGGIAFGYYGNAELLSEDEYETVVNVLASLHAA